MYIVDEKFAGYLWLVLDRSYRNVSFSCDKEKGYFNVAMTENEFRMALDRAACEYEENMERSRRALLAYDEDEGGMYCFTQKKFVTRREAADKRFMHTFVGDEEHQILLIYPEYTVSGQDIPENHSYEVRADIADKVEDALVCCLYDYERDRNRFRVYAGESSFEGIVRHACAMMGYIHENNPDELSLDDEEDIEPADVSAFFRVL